MNKKDAIDVRDGLLKLLKNKDLYFKYVYRESSLIVPFVVSCCQVFLVRDDLMGYVVGLVVEQGNGTLVELPPATWTLSEVDALGEGIDDNQQFFTVMQAWGGRG